MISFDILAQMAQRSMTYEFEGTAAPSSAEVAVGFAGIMIGLLIGIAISVVICLLLYNAQKAVPQQHRKLEPGLIWLLLIPLFNLVWNFFVFLRISESYKSYFQSIGREDVGDAGRGIGLAYAICAACTLIPCLGLFAAVGALVLLIVYLVKIYGLKPQISASASGFPATPPQA